MSYVYDAIESALPDLRREAEAMMTLTLSAYRPDGTTTDANGYEVPAFALVPYAAGVNDTPGKVQSGSQSGSDAPTRYVSIGGIERPVIEAGLHLPIGAPVPVGSQQQGLAWEYEVTALGRRDDPALLNRRYMVVEVPAKSFATARRLSVVEL